MGQYESITGKETKSNQAIEIKFGLNDTIDGTDEDGDPTCLTPMNDERTQGLSGESLKCAKGKYMTHPAFISFGVNGLWVGKFETNNNGSNQVQIIPNKTSWRGINISNMYDISYNYNRKLDSHMMKSTEWGAIAYLTQSIYGRCDSTTCGEVLINQNSSFITGYTESTAYTTGNSKLGSTTGNYTGIYDMSGGAWDQTMSVMENRIGSDTPMYSSSGFDKNSFPKEKKYYDIYQYDTDKQHYNRRILGDSNGETVLFEYARHTSPYIVAVEMPNNSDSWIAKGGYWYTPTKGGYWGIFVSWVNNGENQNAAGLASNITSFRIVLAVK